MGVYTAPIKCLRFKHMLLKNDSSARDFCFQLFKSYWVLVSINFFTAKMASWTLDRHIALLI